MSKLTLPASFRTKWLKALRSGKFKQTRNRLYKPESGGYCCLGVAGRVCNIPNDKMDEYGSITTLVKRSIISKNSVLACNLADLDTRTSVERYTFIRTLINKNDDGVSFNEIADYIEQNTKGV